MFFVSLDQTDLKHILNALSRLRIAVRSVVHTDIPYAMSVDYKNLLTANILSGKFSYAYARYNATYADWKIEKVGHLKFWVLMRDLAMNITMWREEDGYKSGIPAGILDSGDKSMLTNNAAPRYIGAYAVFNEYGWRGKYGEVGPARPVFRPTMYEYKSSSQAMYRMKEGLNKIRIVWR